MARWTYDQALSRLLAHEGGYSNHPSDPGGPTNFGITIQDYRQYMKPNATAADVRTMKLAEATRIYREKYWNAMQCDALPAGVDYCVFDYGVNSGVGRSGKVLKRVLGLDASTSTVTAQVLDAAGKSEAKALIAAICDERLRFLQALKTWPVFGKGWSRRVKEVRAAALAMASAPASPSQRVGAERRDAGAQQCSPGKGAVPVNGAAQSASAGGACAAGTAAATQSSEPAVILATVVLTIAVAVAAYLFWRWWQRRQQHAAA
jgi:lysozyme family protein